MLTGDLRRTALKYAIALDLVIVALSAAYLVPGSGPVLLAFFFAAVAGGAWVAGWNGGLIATIFSSIAVGLLFNDAVTFPEVRSFVVAATAVSALVPLLRSQLARIPRLSIARAPWTVEPSAQAARTAPPPAWLEIAVPLLMIFIYWNASDLLSRNLPIPSLLQPIIAILSLVIWKYRHWYRPGSIVGQPLTLLLTLYTGMLFISTTWARDLVSADDRLSKTVKNLMIYVLAASLLTSWRLIRLALGTLAISAAALAAISIVQIATGHRFGELGGFASIAVGNLYGESSKIRASGPVGDPNFYGQILSMVIPAAVVVAYTARNRIARFGWLALAPIVVGGLLFTYSRGAMLGLAVVTALLLLALRMPLPKIAIGVVVMVGVLVLLPGDISRRFMTIQALNRGQSHSAQEDSSIEKRRLLLLTAVEMFQDNFAFGVGTGNYSEQYSRYSNLVGMSAKQYTALGQVEWAHNLYLELAAENGVAGLTLFLAAMAAALLSLFHAARVLKRKGRSREELIAVGIGLMLVSYLTTSVFLHGEFQRYLFLSLALIAAVVRLSDDHDEPVLLRAAA